MRVSGNSEDRSFNVYLDGHRLEHCLMADDSKGVAVTARLSAAGRCMPAKDASTGDRTMYGLVVDELKGKVEIRRN